MVSGCFWFTHKNGKPDTTDQAVAKLLSGKFLAGYGVYKDFKNGLWENIPVQIRNNRKKVQAFMKYFKATNVVSYPGWSHNFQASTSLSD
jgi:hypothetical protein